MQQYWNYLDKYHFVKHVATLCCGENPLVKHHFYCCTRHKRPNYFNSIILTLASGKA